MQGCVAQTRPHRAVLTKTQRWQQRGTTCSAADSNQAASTSKPKEFDLKVNGRNPTDVKAWAEIVHTLQTADVTMVSPQEVSWLRDNGAVIIDVRPNKDYRTGFIEGACNVPLYQPIEGWDGYKIVRRMGFAMFGTLNATEPNPNFLDEVANQADLDTSLILVCGLGGALDSVPGQSSVGVQSRSLIAAYELVKVGYSKIRVLRDGMNGWTNDGRDVYVLPEDAGPEDGDGAESQ